MDQDRLLELISEFEEGGPVLSIHLPMEVAGAETRKNPIVFKNALREAEEQLEQSELVSDDGQLREQLDSMAAFDNPEDDFWQHQSQGLTLILAENVDPLVIHLPVTPQESSVSLARYPNVFPLLQVTGRRSYLVFTLNLSEVHLYRADRLQCEEIKLDDIPESLEEAMRFDDPEESLQFRSGQAQTGASPHAGATAMYHGQGTTGDEEKNRKIQRFLEMINAGLSRNFPDSESPLILMGTPDLVGHFREMCDYPHLVEETVELNTADLDSNETKSRLRDEVDRIDSKRYQGELKLLNDAIGQGQGSTDIGEIAGAAVKGQVDELWISPDAHLEGSFDPGSLEVKVGDVPETENNLAIQLIRVSLQQGTSIVICPEPGTLPSDASVAARFRY